MKLKAVTFLLSIFITLPIKTNAQGFTVLTEAASLRENPNSERIIRTLNLNDYEEMISRFNFWGKSSNGWINLDYTDFGQPTFLETGELKLSIIVTNTPIEVVNISGEKCKLPKNAVLIVTEKKGNSYVVVWRNSLYLLKDDTVFPKEYYLKIGVTNTKIKLKDNAQEIALREGTPLLITNENKVIYNGKLWSIVKDISHIATEPNIQKIVDRINTLINIFNSAKLSSPIAERLGYYPRLLPVETRSINLIRTNSGFGVKVRLKYHFFTKEGHPINSRKTRLIFKKSNFEFWRKLTEIFFKNGINKFVELDIARFDPEKGFPIEGFIASSYHQFKENKLNTTDSFIENSESELSEDLWFFADEVYERLENED